MGILDLPAELLCNICKVCGQDAVNLMRTCRRLKTLFVAGGSLYTWIERLRGRARMAKRIAHFDDAFARLPKVEVYKSFFPAGTPDHTPDEYDLSLKSPSEVWMYTIRYCPPGESAHQINGTRFCSSNRAHDCSYTLDMSANRWVSDFDAPRCGKGCKELQRVR
jgi:hypothetical protein